MINVQFSNSGLHMSSRRFGSQSLVRLLGHWQQASSRTPLWRQLADALRLLILDGRLALNTRLPGERELATALGHGSFSLTRAPFRPFPRRAPHWISPLPP